MLFGSSHGKRIAFVSNSTWSVYNFRLDVLLNLKKLGYEIIVIATKDEYAFYLQEAGYLFVEVDFNNRTGNPLDDYLFYRKLKRIYRKYKPDFIFHYVTKPNIYGSLAAASLKIPSVAVITGLGYAFAKENWLNDLVKNLYTKALSEVNEAWFLNNEDAALFLREKIVSAEKVKILPGEGVNTAFFFPSRKTAGLSEQPFRFIMSTRLLKSKGIPVYVEAVRILKQKNLNVHCRIIGFFEKQHPDSLTVEDLQGWEKEGLVMYDGFAKDVRPFLEESDCLVFPSAYNEGIPRCLMEAASMELPVITTMNTGCKEVLIENVTGYFCKINNAADLALQMEKMMKLPVTEREEMGRKGRALVIEKFEVTKVIGEYKRILNNL
jgi:glycosyltransferase involved in cell wall biosynthesis